MKIKVILILLLAYSMSWAYIDESETLTAQVRAAGTNWTDPNNLTGAGDDACAVYDNTGMNFIVPYFYQFSGPETGDVVDSFVVVIDGYGLSGGPASKRYIDVGLTKDAGGLAGDLQLDQELATGANCAGSGDLTLNDLGLWGDTWTPAEATDDLFGVLIRDANTTAHEIGIDAVTVTLWWHTPDVGGDDDMSRRPIIIKGANGGSISPFNERHAHILNLFFVLICMVTIYFIIRWRISDEIVLQRGQQ